MHINLLIENLGCEVASKMIFSTEKVLLIITIINLGPRVLFYISPMSIFVFVLFFTVPRFFYDGHTPYHHFYTSTRMIEKF